jgi:hypothetical protein
VNARSRVGVLVEWEDGSGIVEIPSEIHEKGLVDGLRDLQIQAFMAHGCSSPVVAAEIVDTLLSQDLMWVTDCGDNEAKWTGEQFESLAGFLGWARTYADKLSMN